MIVYENGEVFNIPYELGLYYISSKSNYNTVYRNDIIDVDIKQYHYLGVDVLVYDYNKETQMFEKYDNGYYKVIPFYISFQSFSFVYFIRFILYF